MQTRVQLFLTTPGIVRMFGIKSSMKRIVWWYFSWPACLVRSGKPWLCELGPDCFGSRLDLVTGPQHQLVAEVHAGTPSLSYCLNARFLRSYQFSVFLWVQSDNSVVKLSSQGAQSAKENKYRATTVDSFFYLHYKLTFIPIRMQFIFQKDFRDKLIK